MGYDVTLDANGVGHETPLYFRAIRQPYRVGVTHLARQRPGMIGDSFIVGFTATPSGASRTNPITGRPLTFTANEGIWTVRVDIDESLKDICIAPGADGILDSPGPYEAIDNLSNPKIPMGVDLITIVRGSDGICPYSPSNDDESNYHVHSPLPVVQIGDRLAGAGAASYAIDTLATHDGLAAVRNDDNGASRTMRPGDHRVAFFASSGSKQFIVSATHLDSDQDGLLDHWENEGIDSDQDGVIDLNLRAMGAQPCHRDLFIEIDWLNDQPGGINRPHKNRPTPGVTRALVDMFKGAPAPVGENPAPCAIGPGIEAHIDAGPGLDSQGGPLTQNIPGGFFEGGDIITEAIVSLRHINLVYMGLPNSILIPGVVTRSMHDVKDRFFGTEDKRARELAFHYVVLADYSAVLIDKVTRNPQIFLVNSSTTNSVTSTGLNFHPSFEGYHLMITVNGVGDTTNRSGQVREVAAVAGDTLVIRGRWKIPPVAGDRFIFLDHTTCLGEGLYRQDYSSAPGNDVLISLGGYGAVQGGLTPASELGNTLIQSRTMIHELGHNLGLRHGGDDHETGNPGSSGYKPGYLSLMNYYYTLCNPRISNPCPSTYSSDPPPYSPAEFNDWQHLRFDFFSNNYTFGNTANLFRKSVSVVDGDVIIDNDNYHEPTTTDMAPLLSATNSKISIISPLDDATTALAQPLKVKAKINSISGPVVVSIYFDEDGDGSIDQNTERFEAIPTAVDTYEVNLSPLSGTTGWRSLSAKVADADGLGDEVAQGLTVVDADLDNDGDIDQADINLVLALRGTSVADAGDPRDVDGDGQITALDARKLVTLCTRPRCATN